jgi:hypothetical protein
MDKDGEALLLDDLHRSSNERRRSISSNRVQWFLGFIFFRSGKRLTSKLWQLVHACHIRGLCSIACATIQGCVERRVNHVENRSLTGNGLAGNGNICFVLT